MMDYVPQVTERPSINARLDNQRQQIQPIDEALVTPIPKAKAFEDGRALLAKSCTPMESSIGSVPVEILTEIFLSYIRDRFFEEAKLNEDTKEASNVEILEAIPCGVLLLVCRHWRNIVLSTPVLWSFLRLEKPFPNYSTLEKWFTRSASTGLHMKLRSKDIPDYWSDSQCSQLLGLIKSNLRRMRTLSVDIRLHQRPFFSFDEIFSQSTRTSNAKLLVDLPHMQVLSVFRGPDFYFKPEVTIDAPQLLVADMVLHSWLSCLTQRTLDNLTSLAIALDSECHIISLGDLLFNCLNLETLLLGRCKECTRSHLSNFPAIIDSLQRPIRLPRLTSLSLLITRCALLQDLLPRLQTPNVSVINLDLWLLACDPTIFQDALLPLFKQNFRQLRKLNVERISRSDSRIQRLFDLTPMISSLSLQWSILSRDFLSFLTRSTESNRHLRSSCLEEIMFHRCTFSVEDMAPLMELYEPEGELKEDNVFLRAKSKTLSRTSRSLSSL